MCFDIDQLCINFEFQNTVPKAIIVTHLKPLVSNNYLNFLNKCDYLLLGQKFDILTFRMSQKLSFHSADQAC